MSLIDRYRSWFEYEAEAHAKTLAALDSVPESGRDDSYQRALDLFAHLMACRRLWLFRIGAAGTGPQAIDEIFPAGNTRQGLDLLLAEMISDWLPYLSTLDHAELGRRFDYATTEGERFTNSVEEILTQLFGHAWHHRGQIMSIVRGCGGQPQATDFVFWTRRRVDEP